MKNYYCRKLINIMFLKIPSKKYFFYKSNFTMKLYLFLCPRTTGWVSSLVRNIPPTILVREESQPPPLACMPPNVDITKSFNVAVITWP